MYGIVELLVLVAIVGLIAWALIQLVPMPGPFRTIIVVIALLFCLLIVLRAFGPLDLDLDRDVTGALVGAIMLS